MNPCTMSGKLRSRSSRRRGRVGPHRPGLHPPAGRNPRSARTQAADWRDSSRGAARRASRASLPHALDNVRGSSAGRVLSANSHPHSGRWTGAASANQSPGKSKAETQSPAHLRRARAASSRRRDCPPRCRRLRRFAWRRCRTPVACAATSCVAAKQSSTAAGKGASGAFLYSTEKTAHRAAFARVRQTTSWVSRSPITQPPPWWSRSAGSRSSSLAPFGR